MGEEERAAAQSAASASRPIRKTAAQAISKGFAEISSYGSHTVFYTCIEDETVEMVADFCNILSKDIIAHNRTRWPDLRECSRLAENTKLAVPAGCPLTRRTFARDTQVFVDFDDVPEAGLVGSAWAMEDQSGDVWVEYYIKFDDGEEHYDIKEDDIKEIDISS